MRIATLCLLLTACSSSTPIPVDGPSPIDLRASSLVMTMHPPTAGDPAATMGAANRSLDVAPRYGARMLVSLVNISDRAKSIDRFELESEGEVNWKIDPVRRSVNRMLDEGEELELELAVDMSRVLTRDRYLRNADPYGRNVIPLRALIVLTSGEAYRVYIEVPVVEAR